MKKIWLWLFGLLIVSCARDRTGFNLEYSGKHLQRGEILTIEYRDALPSMINILTIGDYGNIKSVEIPVKGDTTLFRTEMTVPEDAVFIRVTAIFNNSYAPFTTQLIYDENGRPVRGANSAMAANQNYPDSTENYLERELKLYPDNAMAFIDRWIGYMMEGKKSLIKKDMYRIVEMEGPLVDAALAYGLGMTGEIDSAIYHLERYMQSDSPKWAPRISMPIRNKLSPRSLVDIAMTYPNHEGSFLIARELLGTGYKSEALEALLRKMTHEKGSYLLAEYLSADSIRFLEYMKDYSIPKGEDYLAEPLLKAAEISLAKGNDPKPFIDKAEQMELKGEMAARLLLLKAKTRESAEEYITKVMALGMPGEAVKLSDSLNLNTDSLLQVSASLCRQAPRYRFLNSNGDMIMPGNLRMQALLFFMPQTRPDVDAIPVAFPNIDFYALSRAPADYIIQNNLDYKNWETLHDPNTFNAFKIEEVPMFIVVDGMGRVRFTGKTMDTDILEILSRIN